MPKIIGEATADFMNTQMVNIGSSYDKRRVSIREYIQEEFVDSYKINESFNTTIKRQAESALEAAKRSCEEMVGYLKKDCDVFVKELRARYDLAFASQVVLRMREEGMLRDDVIAKLLEQPTENS